MYLDGVQLAVQWRYVRGRGQAPGQFGIAESNMTVEKQVPAVTWIGVPNLEDRGAQLLHSLDRTKSLPLCDS